MSAETATAVDHGEMALRAAVAYRVKARVAEICDPVIKANSEHIKNTKGLPGTSAELPADGFGDRTVPVGTFTRSLSKPSFVIEDDRKVLEYADERGETEYIVRPSYITALLGRLHFDPDTKSVVDSTSGEVVPGIRYDPGGETLNVSPKWNKAGVAALDAKLKFIDAMLSNLPELTASDFLKSLEAAE